ncbi:hypothetical protein P872_21045 [Rhodonellum psychrophilum GCM71 = DSM 17998]|uniref:Auto-transporter adhesin, head GIN domain n=2 Tax=Rhodonellum TaxID=336827 RepID=A0A1H3T4E0_9BACT|nr:MULTISPECIES: head GIN domain-containing protein [Rhodonellum]ERM80791.1 hypothetical protein P872_21045 [Rhodonellum psychrophilum GCM71 = DSM 17998]MDO9553588.1 head GIN domain-containing protein [Rhodonellum sp.]SDZ44910.1 Putative auto-transporter adhesin, head GIN domain [Rhodonellum ikkaensis]
MKTKSLFGFVGLFLITFLVQAQTQRETRSLRDFNSIKVSNSIEAELVRGDKNEIQIIASGIELDKVETNVSDNTLEVKLGRGNFKSNSVKVTITYIDIEEVQASTSAKVIVKDVLETDQVYLFATTSAYIETKVKSVGLTIDASTSAKIFVTGTANDLDLKIYTSAEVDGNKLAVKHAEVLANTAAKSEFQVAESLRGSAATGAKVTYKGSPTIVEVKTGTGGKIEKK